MELSNAESDIDGELGEERWRVRPHSAAFESLVRLWGFLRTVDSSPFAFESRGLCGLQVGEGLLPAGPRR